ncbi:uncharacterized protein PV09_02414 [Verruconis gallopava]|uniref:Zn(2)-C6 fungal-type domain-containing protein n=1 Tax=Verruconis gallopava TaxID=253628 RepID=A0A0D2B647_9PEZI|nr:uncharacterized protein PV09_02414 [Verruconis gallopava]KIW06719.1 hypothetical protein PV09_02414 [Verruconis gallopava]
MEGRYARVLPASSPTLTSSYRRSSEEITPKKRSAVIAACDSCRHKKIRCDGKRPECASCVRHRIDCRYATVKGESRSAALKRKYNDYEQENSQLKQVLEAMRTKPYKEAIAILNLVRSTSHLMEVLDHITSLDLTSFTQDDLSLDDRHSVAQEGKAQELQGRGTTRPWELSA